jgi:hypothetical protein
MPKPAKRLTKSVKGPSKSKIESVDDSVHRPTSPLADASNLTHHPPPTTPRVVNFELALPEENDAAGDGWSSDDSFETNITWSRQRVRATPGALTPRKVQVMASPQRTVLIL